MRDPPSRAIATTDSRSSRGVLHSGRSTKDIAAAGLVGLALLERARYVPLAKARIKGPRFAAGRNGNAGFAEEGAARAEVEVELLFPAAAAVPI